MTISKNQLSSAGRGVQSCRLGAACSLQPACPPPPLSSLNSSYSHFYCPQFSCPINCYDCPMSPARLLHRACLYTTQTRQTILSDTGNISSKITSLRQAIFFQPILQHSLSSNTGSISSEIISPRQARFFQPTLQYRLSSNTDYSPIQPTLQYKQLIFPPHLLETSSPHPASSPIPQDWLIHSDCKINPSVTGQLGNCLLLKSF